jgi:hypothetical protein
MIDSRSWQVPLRLDPPICPTKHFLAPVKTSRPICILIEGLAPLHTRKKAQSSYATTNQTHINNEKEKKKQ